jgi:hypothetical protein
LDLVVFDVGQDLELGNVGLRVYPLLKGDHFVVGKSICFGDDGDQVDLELKEYTIRVPWSEVVS